MGQRDRLPRGVARSRPPRFLRGCLAPTRRRFGDSRGRLGGWRLAAGDWPGLAWIGVVRYVERQIGGIWPLEPWARPLEDIGAAVSPRYNYCGAAGDVASAVRPGRRG
ncbi:hypothetical protein NDU88_003065 [Pleurodeles waltl]|uniref:Uncharacterized protein n=1 Tax=Pleurodeles waltl TaxID=8319 RepID=A0AAV7T4N4_PLEWA|nr:hypothetical protein NDU88_003065 [Pleurodeles waltl]